MNFDSTIWYITKFDLLKNLSKEEMCILERSMEIKVVKNKQLIHFPDRQEQFIYFLKKGSVKVICTDSNGIEIVQYTLKPGNIFGELQLLEINEGKNDQAIAIEDSLICFMKMETIKKIMQKSSNFSFTIHKLLGYHVLKLERKLELMIFKNCKTRIVDFLIDIAKEHGTLENDTYIIKNFLTKNDIAKLTGTTQETVNNTLKELQIHNMINYNKRQLEIYPSCYIS